MVLKTSTVVDLGEVPGDLVAVKNEDILKDDASHFRLARSVLKIVSFEFANLQYFNSTFMNLKIVRLV